MNKYRSHNFSLFHSFCAALYDGSNTPSLPYTCKRLRKKKYNIMCNKNSQRPQIFHLKLHHNSRDLQNRNTTDYMIVFINCLLLLFHGSRLKKLGLFRHFIWMPTDRHIQIYLIFFHLIPLIILFAYSLNKMFQISMQINLKNV